MAATALASHSEATDASLLLLGCSRISLNHTGSVSQRPRWATRRAWLAPGSTLGAMFPWSMLQKFPNVPCICCLLAVTTRPSLPAYHPPAITTCCAGFSWWPWPYSHATESALLCLPVIASVHRLFTSTQLHRRSRHKRDFQRFSHQQWSKVGSKTDWRNDKQARTFRSIRCSIDSRSGSHVCLRQRHPANVHLIMPATSMADCRRGTNKNARGHGIGSHGLAAMAREVTLCASGEFRIAVH
jgi:hypothetical protein